MKLRNIINLPVFYEPTATVIGSVAKVVVDDNYRIDYLIINTNQSEVGMIPSPCFVLGQHAVLINDMASIKPCPCREEYTIYEKKLGDIIFDNQGREIGAISDFVISAQDHQVWGVEVFSGALNDILHGRREIPLSEVIWKSIASGVVESERRA